MRSIIIVFAALLMLIALPAVFAKIDDAKTDELTQNFAGVTTVAGVYAANVTLSSSLYNNGLSFVKSVSSNQSSDSPSSYSYNSVSHALEVSGLEAGLTRTLSTLFLTDKTDFENGMSIFFTLLRWFYLFIILGMCGGAVYAFFD